MLQKIIDPIEDSRMRKDMMRNQSFRELKSDIYGYEIFSGNSFFHFNLI